MSVLAGTACVVTGASSGIGAQVAQALAAERARVVGVARRFAPGPLVPTWPRDGSGIGSDNKQPAQLQLDITDEAVVSERFAEIAAVRGGRIDSLVMAAGTAGFGPLAETSAAELREMLEVHVVGTLACARAAVGFMLPPGRGHIVVVSSVAAVRPLADCAAYAAAKAGQLMLTRVMAEELRPRGVRVTSLIVGAVDTPLWDARPGFDPARMMRVGDVAALVVDVLGRQAASPSLSIDELVVLPPGGVL